MIWHPSWKQGGHDEKPFLRWAGSKRQLIGRLKELVPSSIGTYYEPFAGSACLFGSLVGGTGYILSRWKKMAEKELARKNAR